MAGTLVLADDLCWMPAGWVYDQVLERVAGGLQAANPELAGALLRATTEANGGYLDLRAAPATTLAALVRAVDEALLQVEKHGSGAFERPEFYPGFVRQFQALANLLRARQAALAETRKRPTATRGAKSGRPEG
jgi:hypothetical protein